MEMDGTPRNGRERRRGDDAMDAGDGSDSDFEEVSQWMPTQVALGDTQTQIADAAAASPQPPASSSTSSASSLVSSSVSSHARQAVETVRCMICSRNLTSKSIMERELHLNECLDATSLETKYDCPTCGKELTDYNEQRRMAHVNLCLDRLSQIATQTHTAAAASARRASHGERENDAVEVVDTEDGTHAPLDKGVVDLYDCRICGLKLSLSGIEARSRHVKQCGQRFGLRAADMAAQDPSSLLAETEVGADHEEEGAPAPFAHAEGSEDVSPPLDTQRNAFSVMMASSTSRISELGGRVASTATAVVSNAFDVLMKSSRTESIAQAATASTSARSFWHTNTTASNSNSNKRKRFSTPSTASSSAPTRRFGCPDFKRIVGTQPPFIVDGFKYASKSLSSVYFLTHFHSDHYVGLQRSFDCGIIYCNQITSALVVQELGIDSKFVHPVPMNTPVDIRGVQVTFMDANHCPGATIILFKLRSGATYLHTGDFRFHPKMWSYAPLRSFIPAPDVADKTPATRMDGVYLDTTYADPKYTFPTQDASVAHALTLVEKHMSTGEKVLFLFGSYSIGKERLFMEVAERYQRKVCVSKAKLKMIKTYAWPDAKMKLLTTEPAATNLHVVPMMELRLDHLIALQQKHRLRFHQIVAFRPTGWTFSRSNASMSTCQSDPSGNVRLYGIPYSEHSSFAELCEFVRVLNPQTIIPTVNCHTERNVKKQVDALRQSAFHGINNMFQPI